MRVAPLDNDLADQKGTLNTVFVQRLIMNLMTTTLIAINFDDQH